MKKNVFMSIATVLLCLLAFIGCEQSTGGGTGSGTETNILSFRLLTDGTYEVSGIKEGVVQKDIIEIIIPAEFNGKQVTRIGEAAFSRCWSLQTLHISENIVSIDSPSMPNTKTLSTITVATDNPVYAVKEGCLVKDNDTYLVRATSNVTTIPAGIKIIGDHAFDTNSTTANLTIPDTVEKIGYSAFTHWVGLKRLHIPASVTFIGERAFSYGSWIESITVVDGSPYSVVEGCLIGPREDGKIVAIAATTTCTKIPDTVNIISFGLFQGSTAITDIVIPSGVEEIPACTFNNARNLRSVTIPNKVTKIGWQAFSNCANLTNVFIPSSVTDMGYNIFRKSPKAVISCGAASAGVDWDENWNKKDSDANTFFEVNWNATRP